MTGFLFNVFLKIEHPSRDRWRKKIDSTAIAVPRDEREDVKEAVAVVQYRAAGRYASMKYGEGKTTNETFRGVRKTVAQSWLWLCISAILWIPAESLGAGQII